MNDEFLDVLFIISFFIFMMPLYDFHHWCKSMKIHFVVHLFIVVKFRKFIFFFLQGIRGNDDSQQ